MDDHSTAITGSFNVQKKLDFDSYSMNTLNKPCSVDEIRRICNQKLGFLHNHI